MTRIIGLDHGAKRIGVAVGDTEVRMAFAREAIHRRNLADDVARIGELCASEGADVIVVGLPLTMDGNTGEQAGRARAFGDALAPIGATIIYTDERLTSWEAGERLAQEGRSPRRSSGELDSAAARLILQQYLDTLPQAPSPDPHPAEETE
ncbi:MAG TPA: Holliday junction resolvase RuvX [Candidatus Limnocylindria bacterium]